MARLDRNRVMFFGSWEGKSIPETGTINIGDSTGITAASFGAQDAGLADFGAAVGASGEYTFTYDGTYWKLKGKAGNVDITSTYGITATGTPAAGDIIVVDYTKAAGGWEALGKDNDDLSKELNPDTESSKNVLGESTFRHSGYEPEIGIDPYYIDPARKLYERIRENAIEENYGEEDLLGYFAEAYFETANKETRKMTGYCFVRQAWFVPESVGGDTTAFAVPVTIHPVGPKTKTKIVYSMDDNEATITDIDDGEGG